MSDLTFEVVGVAPERYAAVPTITFRVRISETSGETIHAVALRTQIMIEPQRRRYVPEEEDRLLAQFGERERWGQTLKPFLWTTVGTLVTAFTESTEVDVQVPCTYDFELGSTKFLHAVETGEVPLNLLFGGTIFSKGESGFTVEPVPWNKEARFGMPSSIWRAVMDIYFPGTGWIRVQRETLDMLERFRTIRGLPSWERTFDVLVGEAGAPNGLGSAEPEADAPPDADQAGSAQSGSAQSGPDQAGSDQSGPDRAGSAQAAPGSAKAGSDQAGSDRADSHLTGLTTSEKTPAPVAGGSNGASGASS